MWTWVRGTDLLAQKTPPRFDLDARSHPHARKIEADPGGRHRDLPDQSLPRSRPPPSCIISSTTRSCTSASVLLSVMTEDTPRVPTANAFRSNKLSEDFTRVILHYGYMESPRVPGRAGVAAQGRPEIRHHDDIVLSSAAATVKPAPNSGMPLWQDRLYHRLVPASGQRDRLFLDSLRSRRRTRRPGHGITHGG